MTNISLWQWVMLSVVAHVLTTNLLGYAQIRYAAQVQPLLANPLWRALSTLLRVAYFVLVPFAALINGVVSPRLYALTTGDALRDWSTGLLIAAGAFISVSVILWLQSRIGLSHYPLFVYPATQRRAQLSQPWGAAFLLLDTLCLQAHWAFYRAGALVFFGHPLTGALGGLGLVLVEWTLDPAWRKRARTPGQAEDLYLIVSLALLNTVLFIVASHFWLMLVAHALLWLGWLALLQYWYKPLAKYQTRYETGDV